MVTGKLLQKKILKKKNEILVIDDNLDELQTIKTILQKAGYQVETALSGRKGLQALAKHQFSCILLDILMPELSGYELLRLLREKINHKVPIAFISIVPHSEVNLHDVDGFIQKPFSPEGLVAEVKRLLQGR